MQTAMLMLLLFLLVPTPLLAQDEGSGWLPGWEEQLGIKLEGTPAPDEKFSQLTGQVVDAEKLGQLIPQAKPDESVVIRYSGRVSWATEVDGKSVRPCVIRVQLGDSEEETRLLPDRRTKLLRVAPPPFRGSNLKQP